MKNYKNEAIMQRTVTLPSMGKLYHGIDNPTVTLRGMTIRDEIIRLNASEADYKPLADMLDRCIVSDFPMSSYDLCLGDFQYLIFQLRGLTYGNTLELDLRCPYCKSINHREYQIDEIPLQDYTMDEIMDVANIELPMSHERITLNATTPRLLDTMKAEAKHARKKVRANESDLYIKLATVIGSVEDAGEDFDFDEWLENLPMMDINIILQKSEKLDSMIGLDLSLEEDCEVCGLDFKSSLAVGKDFFRPRI